MDVAGSLVLSTGVLGSDFGAASTVSAALGNAISVTIVPSFTVALRSATGKAASGKDSDIEFCSMPTAGVTLSAGFVLP